MVKRCALSGQDFEVTDSDEQFYRKIGVSSPTISPTERSRRRMAFANQRTLFHRVCAGSGKKILSNYPATHPAPVYDISFWFSDKWEMFATGREFNFNRNFFDQFNDLLQVAPRPNLNRSPEYDENSDYTNYAGKNKNCYLIFDSDKNRDCYYSYSINSCVDVIDCYRCDSCELCYECIDCSKCYGSKYLQNCDGCVESAFLRNCIGCNNCFGSVNLRNKSYYIFNEPFTKEAYFEKLAQMRLDSARQLSKLRQNFLEYSLQFPQRYMQGINNEDVSGDYLNNCKNSYECFDSRKLWDCKYITQAFDDARDCMDCTEVGDAVELLYECCYLGYGSKNVMFSSHCLGQTSDLAYCYFCQFSSNCFGCVGLHHAKFCILNKQYTEKEYNDLLPKIIAHMKSSKEWCEFFPARLSPFPYNITHAFDFLPLTKEEALKRGYQWHEEEAKKPLEAQFSPPDTIKEVIGDSVLGMVLKCSQSLANYKIQKGELQFYRKLDIPLPTISPNERFKTRAAMRNPRTVFNRKCARSGVDILTTYSPTNPVEVLCEEKWQKVIE